MTVGRQKDTLLQETRCPVFAKNSTEEKRGDHFRLAFYPYPSPFAVYPVIVFSKTFNIHKDMNRNTATGMYGWRPHEIKAVLDCFLESLLDAFHLGEHVGRFPNSFHHTYTAPLSLRPITVLTVPYRFDASLRCSKMLSVCWLPRFHLECYW